MSSLDVRDVGYARQQAENALTEYAKILRSWNDPDDEHTRITLRTLLESAMIEAGLRK